MMFWNSSFAIENYVLTVKHLDLTIFIPQKYKKNDKNSLFPQKCVLIRVGKLSKSAHNVVLL